MTSKTFHGLMLWAVPRFRRSEAVCSEAQTQDSRPSQGAGLLYQFASLTPEPPPHPRPTQAREPEFCH